MGPAQGIESGDAFAFERCRGQGVQVAAIGADTDLEVSPEVGDAFSHRTPPPLVPAGLVADDPYDPELA